LKENANKLQSSAAGAFFGGAEPVSHLAISSSPSPHATCLEKLKSALFPCDPHFM
jgi:hypothetical protein